MLVLGLCFFAGGIRFYEQGFDASAYAVGKSFVLAHPEAVASTQMHSTLLTISVGALLLPAIYHFSIGGTTEEVLAAEKKQILQMSRGVSPFNQLYVLNDLTDSF